MLALGTDDGLTEKPIEPAALTVGTELLVLLGVGSKLSVGVVEAVGVCSAGDSLADALGDELGDSSGTLLELGDDVPEKLGPADEDGVADTSTEGFALEEGDGVGSAEEVMLGPEEIDSDGLKLGKPGREDDGEDDGTADADGEPLGLAVGDELGSLDGEEDSL